MGAFDELFKRAKITEYLEKKGFELIRTGHRIKCRCPLPGHEDPTPSCYISEFDDGAEYYKCYGCGQSGNIITLIRLMEGKKDNKVVFRELAKTYGLEMGEMDLSNVKLEPMSEDVLMHFCEIEYPVLNIASYGRMFLKAMGGSRDAVNKVSRLYQKLDKMLEAGEDEAIEQVYEEMGDLLVDLGERKWLTEKNKARLTEKNRPRRSK